MMRKSLLLFIMMVLCTMNALAYDIAVENGDGVTIYYNYINDGKELEVTSGANYSDSLVIPEEVSFMGQTLKVTSIGDYAFVQNCEKMVLVKIGERTRKIEN